MESKRAKLKEHEDRLSALPDPLIHYILSLLPCTKQVIRTGVLSKRWENQWTRVPVLIFNSNGMSFNNFLKFIDNTLILHDCPNINKFHITYHFRGRKDPQFSSKIRYATRKTVQDIYLNSIGEEYLLPKFIFNHSSLVKLMIGNCNFMPNAKVNWHCLSTLSIASCSLSDDAMGHILSGSPLLETLLLKSCSGFKKLVIDSNSLKQLVLHEFRHVFDIEMSCPNLEKVRLVGCLNVRNAKLLNLPSSLCAIIDFNHHEDECAETWISLVKDILQQLQHVKELSIGAWFMEYLSALQVGGQFSPVFNNIKCLTLNSHSISGIVSLLCNSPVLEKLVISVTFYDQDYQEFGERYWSDAAVFKCLASHLKNIKIIGFPKGDSKHKVMLNFVQFFLKNARVLEKMIVELKDDGTAFPLKVSQELLSLPRCSQYSIIELLCS